ncbi:probable adenylate kinase 7, mitochondrial isoform X1 [Juglans microcarpa x Juglans regia]|uniref:probable adenylate kinase 7, mitochondrial isoform X1 n=1 Tax=Juglans microcarpa x Juglans regia TaxID=2249226 RepID=UPI001B7E4D5A|nr:probable adenylate kinase 7, mitochondrial isoform X1 [Juglans microcarpa x Juglans regia]
MSGLSRLRHLSPRLLTLRKLASRSYGSAAAQLHYDSDFDDEEEEELQQHGVVGTEGSVPGRGVQWVLIGHRGGQRHVYAERLSKLLEVPHISMGTLVRQELHPRSSLYKQIANAVNEGKLVPEEIIFTLLSKRLEEGYYRGETGFILDGIPRTRMQAEILDQVTDIDLVVNFKCTEEHMVNLGDGKFSPCCGYHSMSNAGCDFNLQTREKQLKPFSSDSGDLWKEKFHIYSEQIFLPIQSKPLEEYYRKQKKLLDFHVAGAPGESWQGLLTALHLQHMNAVSSSKKLTA